MEETYWRIDGSADRRFRDPSSIVQRCLGVAISISFCFASPVKAQTPDETAQSATASADDLVKKLQNPVSSLISVPLQNNFDFGLGPSHTGWRYTLNIQPVVPISLNKDWNLISRTILPVISQHNAIGAPIEAGGEDFEATSAVARTRTVDVNQDGLGDIVQSFFLAPVKPGPGGIIWGLGPVFLLPTATDDLLGSGKWGAGPTAVLLKQSGGWTYGVLANHLWSIAGNENRASVSSTFLQPFLSYTTKTKTTFGLSSESTYDWRAGQWLVPINFTISQLFKIGGLPPMSLQIGARYYADGPSTAPDWGIRASLTLLFPTK
jgi:hypothetical protein